MSVINTCAVSKNRSSLSHIQNWQYMPEFSRLDKNGREE